MKWATRALSHPKIIWSIYCKDAIVITNKNPHLFHI